MSLRFPRGLTAIELLTVISIIGILTAIGVPSYAAMQKHVALNNAAQEIVDALRVAQNRAISSQDATSHGVHFEADHYVSCTGTCDPVSYDETHTLNGPSICAGVGSNIVFTRLTGTTAAQTITVGNTCGDVKTIVVDPIGRITLQ